MDRLVIHAPKQKHKASSNKKAAKSNFDRYAPLFYNSSAIIIVALASAAVSTFKSESHGKPSSFLPTLKRWLTLVSASYDVTIAGKAVSLPLIALFAFLLASTVRVFLTIIGKANLVEAAVEVTPLGVQLVSTFENGRGSSNNKVVTKARRAFLPRRRILDVIVMEVVWPHCVWTQVVFRVLNETHRGRRRRRDFDPQPTYPEPNSVEELLRQNRVDIVPAFPEECRGWLTYRDCLDVQSELERLLHLPSS